MRGQRATARNDTAFTPYMTPINIDLTGLVDSGTIVPGSVVGAGLTGPTGVYTPPVGMNGTETVTLTVALTVVARLTTPNSSSMSMTPPEAGPVNRLVSVGGDRCCATEPTGSR